MDLELTGKVILVTGSTSGIGLGIARVLAAEGARVVLNGRDAMRLVQAQQVLPQALALQADVCDVGQCATLIQSVLDRCGRLDGLVCNVGSGASVPPGQETAQEWLRILELNLLSTTNTVTAATPALVASQGGIVCISSICGLEALGCPVPYAAAKAALESFVRNSARHLGRRGVRINSVAPGNILFPGSVWDRKLRENAAAVEAMLEREVPLKRLGDPADVAHLVAFLLSERATFINGSTNVVDGGQLKS